MLAYIIRRLLYAVPIVLGVTLVTFVLFNALVPPDIAAANALGGRNVSQDQVDTWLAENGYDLPVWPFLPAGWKTTGVSDGGRASRGRVTWQFDTARQPLPATLSYQLTPPRRAGGAAMLHGRVLIGDDEPLPIAHDTIYDETHEADAPPGNAPHRLLPARYQPNETLTVVIALDLPEGATGEIEITDRAPRFIPLPHESQFGNVCLSLLTFNFGQSQINRANIGEMLLREMWPSFYMTLPAFVLGTLLSLAIGLTVAHFRGTYLDLTGVVACVVAMSVPILIYIIFGQYLLGIVLNYFPIYGWSDEFPFGIRFLLMPIFIAVIGSLGADVRLYRTIFLDQVNQDYVRTARAKGQSEPIIMSRHVLPNAMIPILTLLVIQIPYLFIGSLLLERFFGIPGLGARMLESIVQADYPVLRALVFIGSIMFVLGNLLTDICYSIVDPRVRLK